MGRAIPGFLTRDELRLLNQAPGRLLIQVLPLYLVLAASPVLLAALGTGRPPLLTWPAYAAVFVVIGWCQFAIVQALHEAAHRQLGKPGLASTLATFSMTYPFGLTRQFRAQHLAHHRYFGDPERDPDFAGFGQFPSSKLRLAWFLARHGTGVPAVLDFLRKSDDAGGLASEGTTRARELTALVITQGLILLAFSLVLSPFHYVWFWVLPLLTVVKLCTAIRLLCEHGAPDRPFVWRSFEGSFLQRNLLGAFGLNYHAEHHLYPTVPYENLGRVFALHHTARAAGRVPADAADDRFAVYHGGHLGLLVSWFRQLPMRAPA
jgi:fatty acid desaturase